MENSIESSAPRKRLVLYIVFVLVVLISIASILVLYLSTKEGAKFNLLKVLTQHKALAKVGNETIYQEDLDLELHYSPNAKTEGVEKQLLEKIINDSVALQSAEKEGWITLDETIFNSKNKDYFKRVDTIREIEAKFAQTKAPIKGNVLSIWFFNNDIPSKFGYEKGREIAYEKITNLHTLVVRGDLTIEEAAERIKADESLSDIDEGYKVNALLPFEVSPGQKITFDDTFNEQLSQLPTGQVSDVYLAKTKHDKTGELWDAVYMFGVISYRGRIPDNFAVENLSYDSWLTEKRKDYEITYY